MMYEDGFQAALIWLLVMQYIMDNVNPTFL